VREAVEVTRLGAEGFITKPFQFEELLHELTVALETPEARAENAYLRAQLHDKFRLDGMIGRTPIMCSCSSLLRRSRRRRARARDREKRARARSWRARACTTAARGAISGSSRSTAARFRRRSSKPSCSVTCAARSPGAIANRQGRVEQAHRGTLFLDEVGTMSAALQAKLLRVCSRREFERVGESQTIKVDVRVIAATNSDSQENGGRGHVPRGSVTTAST
jgi:DNA-binding NtrC family response regulator